ncbi:MAG: zinc-binding dehydrogenase [Dehalococcoidales bacterium]
MAKCQAWVTVEPGQIVMEEFEIPKVAEDSALLKVEACGICGTDKHVYLGHFPMAQFPLITGHEFIGTIVELGSQANENMVVFGGSLEVGDRVFIAPSSMGCGRCYYCLHIPDNPGLCLQRNIVYGFTTTKRPPSIWGGYSEYVYLLPKSYVFKLSKDLPLKRAILIEPAATGLRAAEQAFNSGYGVGCSAMVLGAGPIGLLTMVSLRQVGVGLIIAQDLFRGRLNRARRMGADLLIDGNRPFEERLKQVREATDGVGPDIVVEAAGPPGAFREALNFTHRGGTLIEAGNFTDTGATDIKPFDICFPGLSILGCRYSPLSFPGVISMLERTPLPVEEIVTHTFSLEEFPKALEVVGSAEAGKVVISP